MQKPALSEVEGKTLWWLPLQVDRSALMLKNNYFQFDISPERKAHYI